MYVYGWDTPSATRVHMIAGVDKITEEKKDKLQNGSAAVMSKDEKGSWAIKVPQGMQHVKIKLKLVDPLSEPGGEFEIKVNDKDKKGKIMGKHETILDIRFLKVTSDEIRISRISG